MSEVASISSQTLSSVKDVVLMACAITGTAVAVIGLNTWKAQANWAENKNLAKEILLNTFKLKDAILHIRNPVILGFEMIVEDKPSIQNQRQIEFLGIQQAYQRRWEKLTVIQQEFYTLLLEADVLWGSTLSDLFKPIDNKIIDLQYAIQVMMECRNPDTPQSTRAALTKDIQRDVIYRKRLGDKFGDEISSSIEKIENYLRTYLGSKNP